MDKKKITNVNRTMLNLFNHKISGISIFNVFTLILCIIDFAKNIYCFYPRAERKAKPVISMILYKVGRELWRSYTYVRKDNSQKNIKTPESLPRFIRGFHNHQFYLCFSFINTEL